MKGGVWSVEFSSRTLTEIDLRLMVDQSALQVPCFVVVFETLCSLLVPAVVVLYNRVTLEMLSETNVGSYSTSIMLYASFISYKNQLPVRLCKKKNVYITTSYTFYKTHTHTHPQMVSSGFSCMQNLDDK